MSGDQIYWLGVSLGPGASFVATIPLVGSALVDGALVDFRGSLAETVYFEHRAAASDTVMLPEPGASASLFAGAALLLALRRARGSRPGIVDRTLEPRSGSTPE